MDLKRDIGMDSLGIFELCTELDEIYNTSIEDYLYDDINISDIVKILEGKSHAYDSENIDKYPLQRKESDFKRFDRFMQISKTIYNIEVMGTETINVNSNYIFCANHESHFDGMWIIGSLDKKIRNSICSIAADYLFKKNIYKNGIICMGGIPIHRNGNSTLALKRALKCIKENKCSLLIHPEGTRTRDGKLGDFKFGAAKLSIESGVKIIPVCINGAYELFPAHRKVPYLFDWKHHTKYKICIKFGTPINPINRSAEDITSEIRKQIIDMKANKESSRL